MAHANINERQQHVKNLLLAGQPIIGKLRKSLAAQYGCTHAAIYADVLSLTRPKNLETPYLNKRIRDLVYAKYGKTCQYCRRTENGKFIIEHIVPASIGGVGRMYNLTVACASCNTIKRNNVWTPRNLDDVTTDHPKWKAKILRESLKDCRDLTATCNSRKPLG